MADQPDLYFYPARQPNSYPPILIVPGAFIGAEAWKDSFVPAFNEAGYDCYTMSFSARYLPRSKQVTVALEQYQRDLINVIDRIGCQPIMLAYSLGGWVTYHYIRQNPVPACLMLSAVPPNGFYPSFFGLLKESPISAAKLLSLGLIPGVQNLGSAPKGIYSDEVSKPVGKAFSKTLKGESVLALAQASFGRQRARPIPGVPIKLYGSTGDLIVSHQQVIDMAIELRADYQIFEGMGHSFMVEPRWPEITGDIIGWLDQNLT